MSRIGGQIVVSAAPIPLPDSLSESEQQIAQGVLNGRTNPEIARARGTTSKTVANQLYAIYRKLGVRSRDEMVAYLTGYPIDDD